jgi:hypothetical protein
MKHADEQSTGDGDCGFEGRRTPECVFHIFLHY